MNFSPVLNENPIADGDPARQNLQQSVLYQMLRLKQLHPQARTGMLPETFDISLDRKQTCAKVDTFAEYATEHPQWGMPYAMPNLGERVHSPACA